MSKNPEKKPRMKKCPDCDGTGYLTITIEQKSMRNGKARVFNVPKKKMCERCQESGKVSFEKRKK